MTELVQTTCRCGKPVEREPVADDTPFSHIANRLTVLCEECAADDERHDRERRDREAAIEQAKATADRTRTSGLPDKHRLAIGELTHQAAVIDAAREWAARGGGLLLTGEIGRGKTTIAGAACWARLQSRSVVWTSAPLLFARLGSGFGSEQRDWALGALASTRALVLDDIDKARPTEYAAEQVFLAVDQRVEHRAPLLVTSNKSPAGIAEHWPEPYGPAIASRLVAYCRVVLVEGPDRRLQGLAQRGEQ